MTLDVLGEVDLPDPVLRLLAAPVVRAQQTWYLGARSGSPDAPAWTVLTLWPESQRDGEGSRCWGIEFRGACSEAAVRALIAELLDQARLCGCTALVSAALRDDSPFEPLMRAAGFETLRSYRTVAASTIAAMRGLALGVSGSELMSDGWGLSAARADELPLLAAMFQHELGQLPPHLLQLMEEPEKARSSDLSLVLRRNGLVVAALIARRAIKGIDVQALLSHPRWRRHRAFAWLLAEATSRWPLLADEMVFSYPQDNPGMADIARRIQAQTMMVHRELVLRVTV